MENGERGYYEEATKLRDAGNYSASIEICTEGVQHFISQLNARSSLSKEDAENLEFELHQLYSCRSIANEFSHKFDAAISDITKVLEYDISLGERLSEYGDGVLAFDYYYRGHLHFRNDAYKDAIADWNIAIDMNPYNADWLWRRATTRLEVDDMEGAIADAKRVREMVGSDTHRLHEIQKLIKHAQSRL